MPTTAPALAAASLSAPVLGFVLPEDDAGPAEAGERRNPGPAMIAGHDRPRRPGKRGSPAGGPIGLFTSQASALGLVTTALVPQIDNFNISTFLVIFPMLLFSGTFFPLEILPGWAMKLALILPLPHVSSLVRGACLGQEPPYAGASVAYLLVFTAGAFAAALLLMRRRLVK
jgi:hypothetical protein